MGVKIPKAFGHKGGKFYRSQPQLVWPSPIPNPNPNPRTTRTPCVTLKIPYAKRSNLVQRVVRETWNSTITDPGLQRLFPEPPMTVFTRCRNLSNYLYKSSSPGEVLPGTIATSLTTPSLEQRVHPCGHGAVNNYSKRTT